MTMAMQTINPRDVQNLIDSGKAVELLDVRSPREFGDVHAASARSVPLDQLDPVKILAVRNGEPSQPLYIICATGGRGAKACQKFAAAGFEHAFNVEGGTSAWLAAGLPVVRGKKSMSLERQTRIAIGCIVLTGVILGFLVHPIFFGLSAFAGAGLIFAGITDICMLATLLARMPWNKTCAGGACCNA